jgi:hypothetical protein
MTTKGLLFIFVQRGGGGGADEKGDIKKLAMHQLLWKHVYVLSGNY